MQLCRLAVAQVVMRGSLLNSTQCPGGWKNALMFGARTGTAHELTRHASTGINALVDGEFIPSLNLLEASRACPRMCCAPYSTTVGSSARNGQ